ncbi:uncharacterized protein LOC132705033 [Cylas formicarius]|uniref:uncharacterized protein LOC132705033 n=1 Tax=Cylas formicarius TaxID=197179 RepID=UPI0029584ED6|nr:uncharacterized protein LOC132705033 [Cylas formicarius]
MKYAVAITLVIATLSSAEPPAPKGASFGRQGVAQPYAPRGFRPAGPGFDLPPRSQRQQLPVPAASYGPPPQEYGPPPQEVTTEPPTTTTEAFEEITTVSAQTGNLAIPQRTEKLTSDVRERQANLAGLFVVVPQSQNLLYSAPLTTSAKYSHTQSRLVPVQAVPAFAKIQEQPQTLQYQLAPVLAGIQEEPSVRYHAVAYSAPNVAAAYVQSW